MNPIVKILMRRDGLSQEDATQFLEEWRQIADKEGLDPEEILHEEFCLEPDYLFDFLGV